MKRARRAGPAPLVLLGVLSLPSCVGYIRFHYDEPIPAAELAQIHAGQDLGECLRLLGAPHQAFEYRGDGMALMWVWRDTDDWSVDIRVPLQEDISASFELDLTDATLPGCVLWFGEDLRLEHWRMGTLGELVPDRVRPSVVESSGG